MSDYIKREDAVKALRTIRKCVKLFEDSIEDTAVALNDLAQSADVVERKNGEWIYNPKDALEAMFTLPKCSLCGHESSDARNYCPNCGADMKPIMEYPQVPGITPTVI